MTDHVRTGYRSHREAVWGLALLLVAAIAAVAIPFASGAPTKTLVFDKQPANPWQKDTPITPTASAIAVKVINGTQGGTPTIAATGAGTTSDFNFGSPVNNNGTWSWPNAKPNSTAPSGLYNLVVTLGSLTATSDSDLSTAGVNDPFRVADKVCPAGQPCSALSDNSASAKGAGRVSINNTLSTAIALDFEAGGGDCGTDAGNLYPWPNRAFYTDSAGNTVKFPAIELNFAPATTGMLQITYMVRNSEWVQTSTSRGNNDAEFCVAAKRSDPALNGGPAPFGSNPFDGKYGLSRWNAPFYWAVLNTVANASKTTDDPVVCARGNMDLPTGPGGASETWRTWTHCIPQGPPFVASVGQGFDYGTKPS